MPAPPYFGHHPRPTHERRLMTHVLSMSACEVGDPVPVFVLMKSNNRLMHHRPMTSLSRGVFFRFRHRIASEEGFEA